MRNALLRLIFTSKCRTDLQSSDLVDFSSTLSHSLSKTSLTNSLKKKRYGSTVPYKPQKILQRFYRLVDTPAPFKRRFNGHTVLKYGAPRIVFGTFRRYGNTVELPCYGSKTGTLFCPLLHVWVYFCVCMCVFICVCVLICV